MLSASIVLEGKRNMKESGVKKGALREAYIIFKNGVFYRNPVLIGALGLYPVAAAGYSLKNGVALSLMMLVMMFPVCFVTGLLGGRVPLWLRPGVVLLLSAVCYLPAWLLVQEALPDVVSGLGPYAPLMICNSVILSRANDYAPDHISLAVVADSLGCTLGFSAVICLFSMFREVLSAKTLWGYGVPFGGAVGNAASLPFFGFLLLGFFAAWVQNVNNRKKRREIRKKAVKQ